MPGQTQCPIRMRSSRKSRIWRRDGRWPRHMTSPAASSLGKPGTASSLSARRHLEVFKYLKKGLVAYGTLRSKGVCLAEPDGSALSGKCDMAHRAFCCLAERQRKEGGRLTTHSIQHQAIRSVPACRGRGAERDGATAERWSRDSNSRGVLSIWRYRPHSLNIWPQADAAPGRSSGS